ncbi:MAG: hypothetical protein IKZ90_05710 [Clostridiales bacterium]|nr:hypothetical protein [Clostridiales bacterium]
MFRSQRVRSAFLAGVLVVSILAGTGCKKSADSKESTSSRSESSEPVASLSSESESSEKQESSSEESESSDPTSGESSGDEEFKQKALKLAQELGVYVLHLFPVVADHLKPEIMYHELMHFIDFSIGGEHRSNVYYTGKYYRKTMEGYNTPASFLSGIEWIYGEETVDRLFFSSDSEMEFVLLLQDAGISDQKIVNIIRTFNRETYGSNGLPENPVRMEDVLVDLYESKKGSGWKEDKVFMQILNEIHAWTTEEYPFEHEELKALLLDYPAMEKMSENVLSQIDHPTSQELVRFFKLILLGGKPYLAADLFTSFEFDRNEAISLIVEYDFDQEKVISYKYHVPDYPKWII